MTLSEILEKAYQVYPVSSIGFSDGDMLDSNSEARNGYIRGYQDAIKDMEGEK